MVRRVHVLGGGSLGTLFAAHFARSGVATTLLLRRANARRCTLRVTEEQPASNDMQTTVACESSSSSDLDAEPFGLLVVAVKAFAARSALDSVASRIDPSRTSVVLLCNGALAVADELPTRSPLLVATTTHGAWSRAPLDVHHAGKGETWVGALPDGSGSAVSPSDEQRGACTLFATTGLGAHVESPAQTERRLWLKLAANAVLNPLTALWDCQNGEVLRRAEGLAVTDAVCDEIAALAAQRADGAAAADATPSARELVDFVHECAGANAANYSSMCMDVRNGRRTEIEQLNGWLEAKARQLGTPHEANSKLADAIRKREPIVVQTVQYSV